MKLYTAVNDVLKRLDDYPSVSGESVWTRAEIQQYLEDGYNAFVRQTKCILDFFYPENIPTAGNYVAKWEETYFDSGMIAMGLLGYSGGYWEQDYTEASRIGPVNHNQPWEAEYLTTTFNVSRVKVADDNVAVDRVTHDFQTLSPEFTRLFERTNKNFQTTSGEPWRYTMDRDGIGYMRVVPAGAGNATQPDETLFPDIFAHWTMGEPSGNRVDRAGTYLVDAGTHTLEDKTGISDVSGLFGRAARFVRTNSDYMEGDALRLGQGGFAVTFWIKLNTLSNFQHIIAQDDGASSRAFVIFTGSGGQLSAYVFQSPLTYAFVNIDSALSDTAAWHFVCVWWNPEDGKAYAHANSTTQGSFTAVSPEVLSSVAVVSEPVKVGGSYDNHFLDADVMGVTIWTRVLTTERTWLYNSGSGRPFPYKYDGTFRDSTHRKAGNWGYGLLKSAASTDALGTWAPVGSRGVLREIPEHFPMGAPYGLPRRLYRDNSNTRVEYLRLGKDLDENQFELPDRFVKYVEYYAQAKALERDGPGQDLALSGHFMQRFGDGVSRMVGRMAEMKRSRAGAIGGGSRVPTKLATARLPWRYGRSSRGAY